MAELSEEEAGDGDGEEEVPIVIISSRIASSVILLLRPNLSILHPGLQ